MNPEFLDAMSWEMAEVYGAISDQILINLARYFPYFDEAHLPSSAFAYQAQMLAQMGKVNNETVNIIRRGLTGKDGALERILTQAIVDSVRSTQPELVGAVMVGLLTAPGVLPIVVAPNQMRAFQLYYRQAADKLNLVNTVMLESTRNAYQTTVSDIVNRVQVTQTALDIGAGETVTGVSSWNEAMRHSINRMKENGITGFIDHAGHRWSAEAYTAMDIRTTVANTARAAVWETNQNFGNDLYSVSYHDGARPLCYPWQNKVISSTDNARTVTDLDGNEIRVYAQSETTYGQPAGLFGINCKHYPNPFIPGVSTIHGKPQDKEENDKAYAESQQQRALERKIREEKRDLAMLKAQGAPEEMIREQREKIRNTSGEIEDFCAKTGRARRRDREGVYTQRSFPAAETYDVAQFEREQKDLIERHFRVGGAQNGFNEISPIAPTSIPTPAVPATVKAVVDPDVVEQAVGVQQYQPMGIDEALKGTNPNYNHSWGYNNNCQRCVQTYEMRRRGYPVEAVARRKRDNNILWGSECFGNYGKNKKSFNCGFTFFQSQQQVVNELTNAPDGSRYAIYITWNNGTGSHVFVADKQGGVVKYIDPQSNLDNVSHYFQRGVQNRYGFFRMDDKPITTDETIIKETMRKGK